MEQTQIPTHSLQMLAAGIASEADAYDHRMSIGRVLRTPDARAAGAMGALAWITATTEAINGQVDALILAAHLEHGATVRELAADLGMTVGSMHRRIARARDAAGLPAESSAAG